MAIVRVVMCCYLGQEFWDAARAIPSSVRVRGRGTMCQAENFQMQRMHLTPVSPILVLQRDLENNKVLPSLYV